jgi:peptidoglycan/xylan/chitin deacetylase (PgdA/CDA1 family)
VVSGYAGCPVPDQLAFGGAHTLATIPDEYPDGRYALSWEELRDLDRAGHVIASHTRSHSRVSIADSAALEAEIVGSQEDFVRGLGRPVRAFAWLMGAAYGENPVADTLVDRAGYEFLFSNFRIQRLPGLTPTA